MHRSQTHAPHVKPIWKRNSWNHPYEHIYLQIIIQIYWYLLITMVNMSYPGWFNPKKPYQDSIGSSNNRNKSLSAFRACLPDAPIWAKLLVKDEHWPDDSVTAAAADFWRPAQLSLPSPNLHSKWSAKAVLFNSFNDDDAPALESWHLGWEHGWFDDSLNNIFLNEKSHLNLYVLRVFIHKYS